MTPQEITTLIKAITPNTPYKEYIPVVTTLIGVTVGFSLNYIRELGKLRLSGPQLPI